MSSRSRALKSSPPILAVAALASACQLIATLDDPLGPSPDAAADVDAPSDAGVPPSPACVVSPPPRPAVANGSGESVSLTFVFGFITMNPKVSPEAGLELCELSGFNVDGKSTCLDGPLQVPLEQCVGDVPCASSCVAEPGSQVCDEPFGVDNAGGRLFTDRDLFLFNPAELDPTLLIRSGRANVLFRLAGYNGEANDTDLTASFFFSTGIDERTAVMPQQADDAASPTLPDAGPVWDGKSLQRWTLDPEAVGPGGISKLGNAPAYVSDNVLVVPALNIRVPFANGALDISNARLTGEIRRRGHAWEIVRGRLGGGLASANLIDLVSRYPIPLDANKLLYLCEQPEQLALLKGILCQRADLVGASGPSCTSLSFGMGFVAVPAIAGPLRARYVQPSPCGSAPLPGCP